MSMFVFLCGFVGGYHRFGETCSFQLGGGVLPKRRCLPTCPSTLRYGKSYFCNVDAVQLSLSFQQNIPDQGYLTRYTFFSYHDNSFASRKC